jgi:hypothetical protein
MENCSAFFALRGPQAPAVLFDDTPAERQAEAGAACLCGKEWIENLIQVIDFDAGARISDVQLHLLTVRGRPDRNATRTAWRN